MDEAIKTDALPGAPELTKSLKARHVAMISIGGIIGGGLFVNSLVYIADMGPAVILSYLLTGVIVLFVMRALGEMATARHGIGSCTKYARLAMGNLAGFSTGWLCLVFLGSRRGIRSHCWREDRQPVAARHSAMGDRADADGAAHRLEPPVHPFLWRVRVLVLLRQGGGDHRLYPDRRRLCLRLERHRRSRPSTTSLMTAGSRARLERHLVGVVSLVFTLVGAEITTVAAAESHAGEKVIAGLTTNLIIRMLLFYVLAVTLIMCCRAVARDGCAARDQVMSPFTMALAKIGVAGATEIMDAIVLVAVLSCLNSGIYVGSRVMFGLASRGDAPAWLVQVDKRGVLPRDPRHIGGDHFHNPAWRPIGMISTPSCSTRPAR